jgi:hypothetical protein
VVPEGDAFPVEVGEVHRLRRAAGSGPTVTVHVASPAVAHVGRYVTEDGGFL